MDNKVELKTKHEEARQEIFVLKDQTAQASILRFLDRTLPKSLAPNNLAAWLLRILILNIAMLLPGFAISFFVGEVEEIRGLWIPWTIAVEVSISALITSHFATQNALNDIRKSVVDKIDNVANLSELTEWLQLSWSIKNILIYVLLVWLSWVVLSSVGVSVWLNKFVGLGPAFVTIPTGFLIGVSFYYIIWITMLVYKLREFDYEVNLLAPANSEAISTIMEIANKHLYISATFLGICTLLTSFTQGGTIVSPVVLVGWTIVVIQYAVTRSTISKIVDRAKWKTLGKLQQQMNRLEATGDLSEKETAERLLRLNDIYGLIYASRIATFDAKLSLNFFSQMMLPLLGLLLANYEKLLALFR